MAKHTLYPLFTAEDEQSVRPILDALKNKGVSISEAPVPKKNSAVLFFLSKHVTEESPVTDAFLRLDAQKLDVIPVNLDGSTPPKLIETAIMARNTIFAERYTLEELVDRIADALKKPVAIASKLRKWIIAAAAVVLLAVVGIVLWRVLASKGAGEVDAEATPAPTAVPTPVPDMPDGIPPEDITKIVEITFVGDTYQWYTSDDRSYRDNTFSRGYNDFSYRYWTDEGAHWLSKEDGHEFPMTHYDDLDWLASLPNLKFVTFCAVDAEVPSLKDLKNLVGVYYCDNNIGTLEWLRGSTLHFIEYHGSDVTDFSPLSDCKNFNSAHLDLVNSRAVDFSGFCPPALRWMQLENGNDLRSVDLSGLSRCANLDDLYLNNIPVADDFSLNGCKKLSKLAVIGLPLRSLSFLSECTALTELTIENMDVGTLNGVENLKKLWYIKTENTRFRDISAISGCTALETFFIGGINWWNTPDSERLRDLTPLCSLPRLREIALHGADVTNLDFLNDLQNKENIRLHFSSSEITDFSGLAAIKSFGFLHCNLSNRDFSAMVLPYIQNATFRDLNLYRCSNVDLSTLPRVTNCLTIDYGDLTSLEGLNQPIYRLELKNCQYLTSLNGIRSLSAFGNGHGDLYIEGCPRLVDWSALDGKRLNRMEFRGTYMLPDFSKTNAHSIQFSYLDEDVLPDLSCLSGLDKSQKYDFDFAEQQNLPDLLPLFELKGGLLIVPPQVSEQAQELVDSRRFDSFEVRYPDGNWEPNKEPFSLLSLDELDTLPKTVLKKVERLCMAGDTVYDPNQYWIDKDWDAKPMQAYLHKNGSDERVPIETGTILNDLSILKNLTGLKELSLYRQPLETLDGIQYLESLEALDVGECDALTDVSAAFTLQGLRKLDLHDTSVVSIEGVQNLTELEELAIYSTQVDSIEGVQALTRLRFIDLQWTRVTDLSPLGALPDDCEIKFTVDGVKVQDFLALPDSILAKMQSLCIAGDWLYNDDGQWWEEDWSSNGTRGWLVHNGGNLTPIGKGTLTDLSFLHRLPNLKLFRIHCNPIVSLDGIETLSHLEEVQIQTCPKITDVSELFDLPTIERISVRGLPITSVAGVEKLPRLVDLSIANTQITDLSPLAGIDTSYAGTEHRGFNLSIDNLPESLTADRFAVLSHFPAFCSINVFNTDCSLWMDALKNAKIYEIHAGGCHFTNETFRQFIEQHPELEYIKVSWTPELTDVSPLLTLKNLNRACVSHNMPQAIASLGDPTEYPFELEIEN
jgi:Leucine-rich repeat (LRR) protein